MRNLALKTLFAFLALGATVAWAAGSGDLDTTFDGDGVARTDEGIIISAVAVQSDGKILVAGFKRGGVTDLVLARYLPDGNLDLTFGAGDGDDRRLGGSIDLQWPGPVRGAVRRLRANGHRPASRESFLPLCGTA